MAKGKKKDKDKKKKKDKAGKLDLTFEGKSKADKKAEKKAAKAEKLVVQAAAEGDSAKPKHAAGHWPEPEELVASAEEVRADEPAVPEVEVDVIVEPVVVVEPAIEEPAQPQVVEKDEVVEPEPERHDEVEVQAIVEDEAPSAPLVMPDEDTLFSLSNLFKIFADPTRLRILYSLAEGPKCVADISEAAGVTQGATSHQLRSMKQERLVDFVRDGKQVIYSLADERVEVLLAQGQAYISE